MAGLAQGSPKIARRLVYAVPKTIEGCPGYEVCRRVTHMVVTEYLVPTRVLYNQSAASLD